MSQQLSAFKGGYATNNLIASGAAFHVMAISFTAICALAIALGSTLIVLHDEETGSCAVLKEQWLLKFGATSIGLGVFFGIVIIVTWVLNYRFAAMFPVSKLNIVASTVAAHAATL